MKYKTKLGLAVDADIESDHSADEDQPIVLLIARLNVCMLLVMPMRALARLLMNMRIGIS